VCNLEKEHKSNSQDLWNENNNDLVNPTVVMMKTNDSICIDDDEYPYNSTTNCTDFLMIPTTADELEKRYINTPF